MKKIFVALMAVLVLASCGEKKEVKTPGDVMMMIVNSIETAAANMENAANADEIIDVMAAFKAETDGICETYGEMIDEFENMDEAAAEELYSKETEALTAAFRKYHEVMMGKAELLEDLTPEQEARLEQLLTVE